MKSWIQVPRLRTLEGEETERRATWLELFFDLVFVAAIAELAHYLSGHVSIAGFFGFVALLIPIWWCWVGATFYSTRFDTDDLMDRLLTLVQMAIATALAVNVHHGLSSSSIGFALSYVAFRVVLIFQFWFAGYHEPIARPLTNWYVRGFSIGVLLWFSSIFVPTPWRFGLWLIGLLVDLSTPLSARQRLISVPPSFSHIPERMGLFVIIVLGESIMAVVRGVAGQEWEFVSAGVALLGLSIAFSLWWIYFESIDVSPLEGLKSGKMRSWLVWFYMHVPLVAGLITTGVGVEHVVKNANKVLPDADRWLFCGGVMICLVALAVIHTSAWIKKTSHLKTLLTYRLAGAGFLLVLAVAGRGLLPITLVGLVAATCIVQVLADLFGHTPAKAIQGNE